jgi:hypothetical protein
MSRERWIEMVSEFESMLDELTGSKPHRHRQKPPLPENPGIYLFSEGDEHLYVGITRNLRSRYGQHQRPSSPENSAPFAFAIARDDAQNDQFPVSGQTRTKLSENQEFATKYFGPAKDRVRAMDFRYLRISAEDVDSDPKIAAFEIFAAVVLGTEGYFNSFRTH